ncbi:MAG: hypothetical protein EOM34_09325 [Clostridia bacterium]|nr:hypothetical protein [Clostridia bacterium]NCD02095.1 hypothetical protein [Clostridia bacterium]
MGDAILGIFSGKADLNKTINSSEEMDEVEALYTSTGLECDFCYTTLQPSFEYCPKCGKKIVKAKVEETTVIPGNLFQTEADRDGLLITQYNGFNDKKVVIPSFIDGKPVIGIWNDVFNKCIELEEVVFEEGCRYIGKDAFAYCDKLKKIHFPKSLIEIGDSAFTNCAFEDLALPPNVKVIGTYVFAGCDKLKKIILSDKLEYISDGMFYSTGVSEISIPESVRHIGAFAFAYTKLIEIELPKNLYSVEYRAFDIRELGKITIHSNVKVINDDIFNKDAYPVIHCAAGSKAQLYARKYELPCEAISPQPAADVQVCAKSVDLKFTYILMDKDIDRKYYYFDMYKAETWSWKMENRQTLLINKWMNMEDAKHLANKIQTSMNSNKGKSKEKFFYGFEKVIINTKWGA